MCASRYRNFIFSRRFDAEDITRFPAEDRIASVHRADFRPLTDQIVTHVSFFLFPSASGVTESGSVCQSRTTVITVPPVCSRRIGRKLIVGVKGIKSVVYAAFVTRLACQK